MDWIANLQSLSFIWLVNSPKPRMKKQIFANNALSPSVTVNLWDPSFRFEVFAIIRCLELTFKWQTYIYLRFLGVFVWYLFKIFNTMRSHISGARYQTPQFPDISFQNILLIFHFICYREFPVHDPDGLFYNKTLFNCKS